MPNGAQVSAIHCITTVTNAAAAWESTAAHTVSNTGQIGKRQSGAEACRQIDGLLYVSANDAAKQQARRGTDFATVHAEQCTA